MKVPHLLFCLVQIRKRETVSLTDLTVCSAEHWECLQRTEPLPKSVQSHSFVLCSKLMTIAGDEAISIQVTFMFKSSSKSVTFMLQ